MGDEMLASVCELAFDVAKEGAAPSAMKNYLYLAQRPPRAYSVAQRALEEDTSFRARVADRATIANVGEAGYLWLHRPDGWEQRFSDLNSGTETIGAATTSDTPLAERPPMPAAPVTEQANQASTPVESAAAQLAAAQPTPATQIPAEAAPVASTTPEPPRSTGASSTVSSIENELSSLRGLVDRLADERQNVRSSVTELEVELETRRAENIEMFTKLSALRNELTTVQSSESTILLDRDRALARVTELEADVARLNTEVERLAAEAEGSSSEHVAALTDLATVSSERDELRGKLAAAESDRTAEASLLAGVRSELSDASTQRDSLQGELDAVTTDRNSLSGQFNDTLAERDRVQAKLDSANKELGEARSQLATVEGERNAMTERLTALDEAQDANADLTSRLAVAEQARIDLEGQLEDVSEKWKTATRQLSVFENVNSQLDAVASERDELQEQLARSNDVLAGLQSRIGTSHDQIRNELTSIESTFGEAGALPSVTQAAEDGALDADAVVAEVAVPVVDEPDLELLVVDSPEQSIEEISATDISVPEITTPEVDLPPLDGVTDIDVPSIGDSVDFDADASVSLDAPADEDDFFDGQGIEMDPTTLGGRTIGDMFGGGEDVIDTEGVIDDEPAMNGLTSPDAAGLDELARAASDEPLYDTPPAPEMPVDPPQVEAVATPATGRRQLSFLPGLDDASIARQVVGSPDVVLLIDGDGTAGLGWPHLDVATRRGALVDYLGTLTAETGAAADVVFARPVGGEDALPVSRAVRVRIADAAVSDSPIFGSIVDGYPEEWPIAIVTNEPSLVAQADTFGATVLSNDQLLDLFLDLNSEG